MLYKDFQREYAGARNNSPNSKIDDLILTAYERFSRYRQSAVGHYFRTLYNIVKFVDNSAVEDKQIYINLLRAQLSSSELNLLFYNCLSRYGYRKFRLYVEKFGLLENMALTDLISEDHKDLYAAAAFQNTF